MDPHQGSIKLFTGLKYQASVQQLCIQRNAAENVANVVTTNILQFETQLRYKFSLGIDSSVHVSGENLQSEACLLCIPPAPRGASSVALHNARAPQE